MEEGNRKNLKFSYYKSWKAFLCLKSEAKKEKLYFWLMVVIINSA